MTECDNCDIWGLVDCKQCKHANAYSPFKEACSMLLALLLVPLLAYLYVITTCSVYLAGGESNVK